MSFQYPLGLLGLLGIPVLVIIYIIKSKFTEQTVAATYLWTLSERFLKKKRKDNKITGIISLILQLLAVVLISLTIAHPVISIRNGANEFCFVIDQSGSMNIVTESGKTRLDVGKERIGEIIEESGDGSIYTLICVGDNTNTAFERIQDKKEALTLLENIEPGYSTQGFAEALSKAQSYFDQNNGTLTYLVTDKEFSQADNISVINVTDKKDNYALFDVVSEYSASGMLTVSGKIVSYESDATIRVQLFVDELGEVEHFEELSVKKAEPCEFSFTVYVEDYEKATVKIINEDALMLDNESVLYNLKKENSYKTLLVSQTPFFLETVLKVVGSADVTVMSPDEYLVCEENSDRKIAGYGLYVFHSCNPVSVPTDGSVWLINTSASVANSGFNYQGKVELYRAEKLDKTKASASVVKKLLENVDGQEIYVSQYAKYDMYRNFNTLFTHNGNPMIFTGLNAYGNREVVFSFDLHNSDMPLLADYVFLIKNLLDFSFPTVIDDAYYMVGEKAQINVVSNCESLRVESPNGKISHLSVAGAVSEFTLNEVGIYTIKAMIGDTQKEFHIYSAFADEEKDPVTETEDKISLIGEASEEGLTGIYDKLIIFFIALAVIMAADWVVYCYEKYQLR